MLSTSGPQAKCHTLETWLTRPRYEVVPLPGVENAIRHVPEEAEIVLTCSPRRSVEYGAHVAALFRDRGVRGSIGLHVAAKRLRDRGHLLDLLKRCADLGIEDLFVIGGDGPVEGAFADALPVVEIIRDVRGSSVRIGIAGYPEGHPQIPQEVLWKSLAQKAPLSDYLVTQMCFDAATISDWLKQTRQRGIALDVFVGLPGHIERKRLISLGLKIGVGTSLRFLGTIHGVSGLLSGQRYDPRDLVTRMAAEPSASDVRGLHLFTFNQIEETEAWRSRVLSNNAAGRE